MSKELNKAPVEQAGGDERAAFEAWLAQAMSHKFDPEFDLAKYEDSGEYRYNPAAAYWKAWQARAALAQPSPTIATAPTYQFHSREIGESDWAPCDFSWYLYCSKSPEMDTRVVEVTAQPSPKSGYYSDQEWINAGCPPEQPSPVQAEQAEAERPEVVARVVHSTPVVLDQCAPLNANDELMTVAQHAASVARWAEMLNRVEQERDVALARVAELERQEPVDVPGPDEIHQMAFEEGQPAEDGDGYLFSAEEFDLFVQRLLDSCATPVAWAQHSVPEGWMLVECGIWTQEQVDEMQKTVTRFRNSEFVDDRALAMAVADAGQCKAPEISLAELLAAAPVCRLSRSALTDAQMRRLYENSTETENERLGFEAFARLIRRAEAVHQITAAPGKEGV
ncbi:hypothetical protein ACM7KH_02870 [Pseudomonas aeruginosa]